MAVIELRQVSKHFGSVVAVDEVSLTVEEGDFIVLVGPSGCGKTTLLRMIAGLSEPTAGRIHFDGADISAEPPGRRNVAMVFQNYALFPHMTVERNLSFGLRLRRAPAAERRQQVEEVARLLKIDELLKRFPRELSGGQKQRVALGRALIRRPVAFLFDEPLSNLDPALRVEMRAEIAQLHRRYPVTTVYVTHDQIEAMTMGDRIAVMHEGRLMQVGEPKAVYHNPDNLFTATFIGSPAMNTLALAPTRQGDGAVTFAGENGLTIKTEPGDVEQTAEWPEEVIVGVRPEHLSLCSAEAPNAIGATVQLVEELGREHIVYLTRNGLSLRAVAAGSALPRLGETVHVAPRPDKLYFFDPLTGDRL